MTRTISVVNTDPSQAGKRGISKKFSRRDLERTLLDLLTWDEDVDFCEAQEIVEEAEIEALVDMIWELENGKATPKEILERYGY